MDLNDLWQGNKRFILGIGCALVLLLIAEGIIGSVWDVGTKSRTVASLSGKLRREEAPKQSELADVEGDNMVLSERLEELYGQMTFETADKYVLPEHETSPDLLFNTIRSAARDELVDVAARRNIRVDASLGLPEFTPSGREAIQRALAGLNIVEQVVTAAIVAGVRGVPEIEIIDRKGSRRKKNESFVDPLQVKFRIEGSTSAVAELVQTLVRGDGQFLCVEEAELYVDPRDPFASTSAKLTVSGLAIDSEATVSGG